MYPFIDTSTGGNINGMIASANAALELDRRADHASSLATDRSATRRRSGKYRDVLVTVRDRVQKLKSSGQTLEQVVAAKPTKDLDDPWGKGFMQPDFFVTNAHGSL